MRNTKGKRINSQKVSEYNNFLNHEEREKRLSSVEYYRGDQGEKIYNNNLVSAFSLLFGDSLKKDFN